MKKFLIATAALAITAGAAAAEVSLSGDGRMGVVYDGDDVNFSSRVRAKFTLSGSTDSGLEFGGSFRADDANSGDDASNGSAGSIWVSGAFGKIEMGDTDNAAETIHGDLPEVGFTDLEMSGLGVDLSNDIPFLTDTASNTLGDGNPNLLYTYSMDAFDFALSLNDGKDGTTDTTQNYAVGVGYSFGAARVGLAYEVADFTGSTADQELLSLSVSGEFAGVTGAVYYADGMGDGNDDVKAYGIGGSYTTGATTINGYVQKLDTGSADVTWYGLGAEYDLGGGASVVGGVMDNDLSGSDAIADLGLKFSF